MTRHRLEVVAAFIAGVLLTLALVGPVRAGTHNCRPAWKCNQPTARASLPAPTASPPAPTAAPTSFPWATLQAAVDATAPGGTVDATGRTFYETITIQKALTIKGGTIDGQGLRTEWVRVWAADVTITDATFRNAKAGALQSGSISVSGARFRLIRAVAVSGSYAALQLWPGSDGALIEDADFSGAPMGIIGYQTNGSTIRGGRIHHATGTPDLGNESGGIKLGQSVGARVENVEIDHNVGPGAWLDVYCTDGVLIGNDVHDNSRVGIMVEIEDGYTVTGNTVYRNALGNPGNAFQMNGGILVSSSRRGSVSGNTVAWNGFGTTQPPASDITFVSQNRAPLPHDGNSATGNVLRRLPLTYTDFGDPNVPVTGPNTLVADTDPRIAGLK